MLTEDNLKTITTIVLIILLFVTAILIVRPIIISIISGALLAYIFYPVHKKLKKGIKSESLSALIICIGIIILTLIVLYLILVPLVNEAINLYLSLQKVNFVEKILSVFSTSHLSSEISASVTNSINSLLSKAISSFLSGFSGIILKVPEILLNLFLVIFIFFFSLRDGGKAIEYFKSIFPLSKEIQNKFYEKFKNVTNSILLGNIVVGLVQGLSLGLILIILGIPNSLILTVVAMVLAIIPVLGAWLVWIPITIILFVTDEPTKAIILLIYSLIVVSWIDDFVRPFFVSKRVKINTAIVLIGMLGGMYAFGILGLILGPLILSYVLLVIELYKQKKTDSIFITEPNAQQHHPSHSGTHK